MTKTAKIYGDSLYDLTLEKDAGLDAQEVLEELQCIRGLFRENPDFLRMLQAPQIAKGERIAMVDQAFGDAALYVRNFLKVLLEEGLLAEFSGCLAQYRARFMADHGMKDATVTSAKPLSAEQAGSIREKLEQQYGCQILLTQAVDESLLGGLIVTIDGKQLDGSVRGRLQRLQKTIRQEKKE